MPNPKRLIIDTIIDESMVAWRQAGAPPMLCTFAEQLRRLFLLVGGVHLLQPCSAVSLGGMEGQASSDSSMQAAMIRGRIKRNRSSSEASGKIYSCRRTIRLLRRTKLLFRLCRNSSSRPTVEELPLSQRATCSRPGRLLRKSHAHIFSRSLTRQILWPSCLVFQDLLR